MVIDISNGAGKVFVGIVRTIDERKGIVAKFGQFESMRKAVVHSPDIGERTTGIANGKGSIGASSEKEQSRVTLLRVGQLLGFRIDVEEYAVGMSFM